MSEIKSVCVYSASSTLVDPCYRECAVRLGKLLASRKIRLINGAGNQGLMRACADGVLANGGQVTGVIPRFMVEQGWLYEALTEIVQTVDMHERKSRMAELSDGIIALPGGCGTLEELLESITWKQLGLYLKPIVILNVNHYFDPLLEMLRKAVDEHFMRTEHASIWQVAHTPEEAVDLLFSTPQWSKDVSKTLRYESITGS